MKTLVLVFKKIESEDKTKCDNFYSSSKAEIVINESDFEDVFQSVYTTIITNTQKSLGKGSEWITDSVIDHTISISKYNHLAWSSCTKLPKELGHPRKYLINVKNSDDNECFKLCLVRYLNSADHNARTIIKADKNFELDLVSKILKFSVKIRDIPKIEKRNFIGISVLVMKIRKIILSMYQ